MIYVYVCIAQVTQCEERMAQSSSIQVIHALQEITKLNQALHQVCGKS